MSNKQQNPGSGVSRLLGHASIYALGNISRQLVGFLMLPVYTRYLTPADYGVIGLMLFAISLIELGFGARLGLAIPKYYFDNQDKDYKAKVVSTALIITGCVSTVTTIAIVMLREPISLGVFGTSQFGTIVGLFAVQILTQAMENYALVYLRLQQRPWFYISVSFAKLVVQLSLNIWLVVFLEMGVLGVAYSAMLSSSIFALLLLAYTLRHVGWGFDSALARKMVIFCWPLWLAGFAGLYVGSANRYFLRIFSSLDDVGLFELAAKFGIILSVLIWEPFATYWEVERFKYYQQGNAEPVFQKVFLFISTLLVLAALGIAIFSGPVIRLMADQAFHRAAVAVPFLAFASVFRSLVAFTNFSFLVTENTRWISRNNYMTAIVITIFYLALIPVAGHVGAALAAMFASAVQFLIVHRAARRFYDMHISLKPLMKMLLVSVIGCFGANISLARDNILADITLKLLIFTFSSVLIIMPIFKNYEAHQFLHQHAPHAIRKYIFWRSHE